MASAGIAVRIATKKLAAEEAPASYKDVDQVSQFTDMGGPGVCAQYRLVRP
jgi:RNA-splicing ligase RtcB